MDANTTNKIQSTMREEDLASGFPIDRNWYPIGIIWLPSVLLGLPANILVIFLGKRTQLLGNFCFAINAVSFINSLHLLARATILIDYFSHLWLSFNASVIECSIMGNILDQYVGYYIVFYIPILALYRYLLLCTKNGYIFLSKKRNVWFMIIIAAVIPTIYVAGKLYGTIIERKVQTDDMCPFKYDDNWCNGWCDHIYNSGVYASYGLCLVLSVLLFIHLYQLFRKVHPHGHSQRRKLSDEVRILTGVVLHTLIPVSLTILTRGKPLLSALGIKVTLDNNIAQAVYNYNPLCDAVLIIFCVNPYRRAFMSLLHLDESESIINHRAQFGTNGVRMAAVRTVIPART